MDEPFSTDNVLAFASIDIIQMLSILWKFPQLLCAHFKKRMFKKQCQLSVFLKIEWIILVSYGPAHSRIVDVSEGVQVSFI